MASYDVLAAYYDRFTDDVDYVAWADYFEAIFARESVQPALILDLACGTGTMTALLAARSYNMIGVDASAEMLTEAASRTMELPNRPLLLQQRMEHLELYGEVDACVCCLDSVNYVTEPEALRAAMRKVHEALCPGGLFIFDINTPRKFHDIAGQSFVREDGDVYCVWQCLLDESLCTYQFDIFEYDGKSRWRRSEETHYERIYEPQQLKEFLQEAGFEAIQIYPELSFGKPSGSEHRLFFTARKGNA